MLFHFFTFVFFWARLRAYFQYDWFISFIPIFYHVRHRVSHHAEVRPCMGNLYFYLIIFILFRDSIRDSSNKSKLDANCFDDFSNVKLFSIYVCYKITANSYEFIRRLLSLPNVQVYLTSIWLVLPKLSQALSILSQLSDCLLIESVDLSYWENDSEVDPTDLIKSSIYSITKKVGIINKLNVSLEISQS